jgi:hypothetical protein
MNLKRLIGSLAIAGVVAASSLGIGTGIANANPVQVNSGPAVVQPVGWHGDGHGHGWGYGGGWHGDRGWHPWGWPWRW